MSNFSKFHQNYESASHILINQSWIFFQFCRITAGCNFNNQLLFTAFSLSHVDWNWIKAQGVSSLPIVFRPLTVKANVMIRQQRINLCTPLYKVLAGPDC